jgi:acetyl esterase/lipase
VTTTASGPAADPRTLTVEHSDPASVVSRLFAVLIRLTLKQVIKVGAAIGALSLRFGPDGFETWRAWTLVLRFTDWLGNIGPPPRSTYVDRLELGTCRAEWVRARGVATGPAGRAILYFHGGGYVACGLATHRRLAATLSRAADATVLNVDYRMLPRNTLQHAIEDGVAGYARLLEQGYSADRIVIAGDSAGGGLSFLVAVAIRNRGLPAPAGIVGISPWTDLDPEPKLAHRNARTDPLIPTKAMSFIVESLICKGQPLDPDLSPVNLDLAGLPPTLVHVGTTEVLELDAIAISDRLAAAGVPVTLKHWDGQVHDFQLVGIDLLPEARQAIREIGAFVRARTAA